MYPTSSVEIPWINVAFPSTAAAAAGVAAGLRALGREDEMTVLAMAGDGGTSDIGMAALSGAAGRNDDFIYVCYDNERIMEAHGIPYVASTSVVFPDDVYDKVARARGIAGMRYIHMNTPCPSGWSFDPKDTVALGKLAVDAGIVVLYEVENGVFRLTGRSRSLAKAGLRASVADYVATQGRFRGMSDETVEAVQAWVDARWADYVARDAAGR